MAQCKLISGPAAAQAFDTAAIADIVLASLDSLRVLADQASQTRNLRFQAKILRW
jgi:hypothetical protein